jgi:hypothetical protein
VPFNSTILITVATDIFWLWFSGEIFAAILGKTRAGIFLWLSEALNV